MALLEIVLPMCARNLCTFYDNNISSPKLRAHFDVHILLTLSIVVTTCGVGMPDLIAFLNQSGTVDFQFILILTTENQSKICIILKKGALCTSSLGS